MLTFTLVLRPLVTLWQKKHLLSQVLFLMKAILYGIYHPNSDGEILLYQTVDKLLRRTRRAAASAESENLSPFIKLLLFHHNSVFLGKAVNNVKVKSLVRLFKIYRQSETVGKRHQLLYRIAVVDIIAALSVRKSLLYDMAAVACSINHRIFSLRRRRALKGGFQHTEAVVVLVKRKIIDKDNKF